MGALLSLLVLCSPSKANIDWERIENGFEIFVNMTEVIASMVLPIVGEIISIAGHPEIGDKIGEVGKVTTIVADIIQDIQNREFTNTTSDVITVAKEIAEISGDKHSTKVIGQIGDIFSGQNLKLPVHESVFPLNAADIEQLQAESVVVSGDESAIGHRSVVITQEVQSPFALENQHEPK